MSFLHTSMKSLGKTTVLTALVVFMAVTAGVSQETTSGVQARGWTPIQLKYGRNIAIFSNRRSVYGIRLSLLESWPSIDTDQQSPSWERDMADGYRATNIIGLDLSLGLAYPITMRGIQFGGLFAASSDMRGIAIGGLCAGAENDMRGVAVGTVAGSKGDMRGVAVGLLAAFGGEDMRGIAVGGALSGAGRSMKGIVMGGLFAGVDEELMGIAVGGGTRVQDLVGLQLAIVSNIADIGAGAQIAIGGNVCEELNGIQIGLLNAGGFVSDSVIRSTGELNGAQIGIFNECGKLNGAQIGIFNECGELKGVQIGLLNIAEGGVRWPLINVRF
jgi:hypothetical protein